VGEVENENKLATLKAWAAKLDETIVDKDAKKYSLKLPKYWLDEVERKVVPGVEFMLPIIEKELQRAEDAVSQYGPNLRIIGQCLGAVAGCYRMHHYRAN
jgi:hypothetical protein